MIIKLTEQFYSDDESIQTVQFYEKGDKWFSPTIYQHTEKVEDSTFEVTFRQRTPVRLVGPQADEAWANWKTHTQPSKPQRVANFPTVDV